MKDGRFAERYARLLSAYRVLPNLKRLGPHNAIMNRLHEMAGEPRHIPGESVEREKPMSMSRRGKPTHVTFPLASRIVRYFRSVICVNVIDMIHSRHDRAVSGVLAFQFVRDQPSGFAALADGPRVRVLFITQIVKVNMVAPTFCESSGSKESVVTSMRRGSLDHTEYMVLPIPIRNPDHHGINPMLGPPLVLFCPLLQRGDLRRAVCVTPPA